MQENENSQEERRSGGDRRGGDDIFVDRAKAADAGLAIIKNFVTAVVLLVGFGVSIGIQISNNHTTAEKIDSFNKQIEALSKSVRDSDTARQLTAKDDDNRYSRLKDKVDAHDSAISTIKDAYQFNLNARVSTIEGLLRIKPPTQSATTPAQP